MAMRKSIQATLGAIVALTASVSAEAREREVPPFLDAPAHGETPKVTMAVVLEMKLHVTDSSALTALLVQAGLSAEDADAAAQLASKDTQLAKGPCDLKIAVSKQFASAEFRLERMTVWTATRQTVIERRGSELAITAGAGGPRKSPPII
jgi:hypothetical protein